MKLRELNEIVQRYVNEGYADCEVQAWQVSLEASDISLNQDFTILEIGEGAQEHERRFELEVVRPQFERGENVEDMIEDGEQERQDLFPEAESVWERYHRYE